MTLNDYIEYKEKIDVEKFEKAKFEKKNDDDNNDSIEIIIENKFQALENMIKLDKKLKYKIEEEETCLGD